MIPIKSQSAIEIMIEGGKRLAWVFHQVLKAIKPGVVLKDLDKLADSLIKKQGGFPSFKMVSGYYWATCLNVNQGVVHGIPNNYQIKKGDVVTLDIGMFYKGFHTDMARTLRMSSQNDQFLKKGEEALKAAIKTARAGNRVGHLSLAIEREIKKAGFNPVKNLTGHGVGKSLHEEPPIPCFFKGAMEATPILKKGMTLALEVIYTQSRSNLVLSDDGWTIETADGKLAALFENTILIREKEARILTCLN